MTGAFAAAAITVLGLGATQAGAATGAHAAPASSSSQQKLVRPMDGPPGTVWTGKKFWTLSGCQEAGTDLVAGGHWADPFCDGSGLKYDLWARPI
jgi:hypothetical protein